MGTAFLKYKFKMASLFDVIRHKFNKLILGNVRADKISFFNQIENLKKKYLIGDIWNFKGIMLPYSPENDILMPSIYKDSLFIYCVHNDNYNSSLIDKLEIILPEGPYSYKDQGFDVTIHAGDVVIDAGAWIGDFSAYAEIKGATVYAFEPIKVLFNLLERTKEFHSKILPVRMGLGNIKGTYFITRNTKNTGCNKIESYNNESEEIEVTTIDDFVKDNHISKVDFIKADIEGFERNMLAGAKETLNKFAPKLAICTYHFQDDPQVLSKIILESNPNYKIIQKKKKLYAAVPN